jgi:hypothetical protein
MAHVPVLTVADNLHLAIELPDSRYLSTLRLGTDWWRISVTLGAWMLW